MNSKEIIQAAREGFDHQLHSDRYKAQHSDENHLSRILSITKCEEQKTYLDLGTGNGYIAFALAEKYKESEVVGLDISHRSIAKNNLIAREKNITNARFLSYDGFRFPLENQSFQGIYSRYAFHHFPNPADSIAEMKRILKPGGYVFLSDPKTLDRDRGGFVDQFQSLLPDGHVHFYLRSEMEELFQDQGFRLEREFPSEVRYPRIYSDEYKELIKKTDASILQDYQISIQDQEIFITTKIMNLLFRLN